MTNSLKVIILAGTAGTGKSTIGDYLLKHYKEKYPHIQFIEGDDLHPPENVAKMSAGHPLNDDDRWEWLKTVAHKSGAKAREGLIDDGDEEGVSVVACSSLKLKYRDLIRMTEPNVKFYFLFLYASKETILYRLNQRKGHFMKSNMLESQFADLELPKVSEEKDTFIINMDAQTFEEIEDHVYSICDRYIL
ncbi:hypothetical protein MOSE0_L06370 [Monosporozyma servazzii]